MKQIIHFLAVGIFLIASSSVRADIPKLINFQGILDSAGTPLANRTLNVEFKIYDADVGGNLLWSETTTVTTNASGIFSRILGSSNPIPDSAFANVPCWLGTKVGTNPEISPRQELVSVPYSYRVGSLEGASGGTIFGNLSIQSDLTLSGAIELPVTTATTGIIKAGGDRFLHNFGLANTFVGINAGNLSMTGGYNTASGYVALYNNASGSYNSAHGYQSLLNNTTGSYNTSSGYLALFSNTTGSANTATGNEALYSNTTGLSNTATGNGALYSNTTGNYNTANGDGALFSNTTGSNNTALGRGASGSTGSLTNATAVGSSAIVDASNKVRVGNTSVTSIGGQVGWTTFSDGRYKKSVSENVPGLAFITKLKPLTYTVDIEAIDAVLRPALEGETEKLRQPSAEELASKQAASQILYSGFMAQEVEKSAKELGYDFSGIDTPKSEKGMYGLRYAEFVVPLVKAVQEQQKMMEAQEKIIQDLQTELAELRKEVLKQSDESQNQLTSTQK